jgi:hypothetical protein
MLQHQLERVVSFEHHRPGEQEVPHAAQGVEIGSCVHRIARDHLGGHVCRGARQGLRGRQAHVFPDAAVPLHQAEVQHLHEIVLQPEPAEVEIGRLDVAVYQPPVMGLGEGPAGLAEYGRDPGRWLRTVAGD